MGAGLQTLVLASTSPWRRQLLESAGVKVTCVGSGVDERATMIDDPVELARVLAEQKAMAVAEQHPAQWVLGSDQVGFDAHGIFGKPADPEAHLSRLLAMRGRTHTLVTAWCLLGPGDAARGISKTRLTMRADLSVEELSAYVESGEGSGCAGGYAIEGKGVFLFERIDGDWFNIVGLPLLPVMTALRERGWRGMQHR